MEKYEIEEIWGNETSKMDQNFGNEKSVKFCSDPKSHTFLSPAIFISF